MKITEELKKEVWAKGIAVEEYPEDKVRKDACGAFMLYEKFGNRQSPYGWEIDHICPISILEGLNISSDDIDNIVNLRPMNWENNNSKGDDYPSYSSVVTAGEDCNIRKEEAKIVNVQIQEEIRKFYHL